MIMATYVTKNNSKEVIQTLNELFGNVLHIDVIKSVASSCHYDIEESSNRLVEMTSTAYGFTPNPTSITKQMPADQYPYMNQIRPSSSTPTLGNTSKKAKDIERTIKTIEQGYKVLILMRGLPGSGKSYLATKIVERTIGPNPHNNHILSADDYFIQNGTYSYNPACLTDAHGWNHQRAFTTMNQGISPVIIDNTNSQLWEMKPYAMMATDFGYIIEILEPDTHWCFNDKELARRNQHGVTKSKIKDMIGRYDRTITPRKLLNAYNLRYTRFIPPQMRVLPPLKTTSSCIVNGNSSTVQKWNEPSMMNKSNSASVIYQEVFNSPNKKTTKPIETINLMEFNDEDVTASSSKIRQNSVTEVSDDDEISVTSWDTHSVDDILMWKDENSSNVLQPANKNLTKHNGIENGDGRKKKWDSSNLFSGIDTVWGINEAALRSWDIVMPITELEKQSSNCSATNNQTNAVETKTSSSNTDENDFYLLSTKDHTRLPIKVIQAFNRNINLNTPAKVPPIPQKIVTDKSCSTEDIYDSMDYNVQQLKHMFPNMEVQYLKNLYRKFSGNVEMIIELLLDPSEAISLINNCDNSDEEEDEDKDVKMETPDEQFSISNQQQSSSKPFKRKNVLESSQELKECLESRVTISNDFYSDRLLKLKYGRLSPETNPPTECINGVNSIQLSDSDEEELSENVDDDLIELKLGDDFVTQLEEQFADPTLEYPKGFQPVVQVPANLARQLYTFYLESVFQQMEAQHEILDTLVKEDEEFAKKLQAQEEKNLEESEPPNMKDIMLEQKAEQIYRREADEWKNMTPDTFADRLTRQKLFASFPSIDPDDLLMLLHANNNNYQETVDSVLDSVNPSDVNGSAEIIREPPISEAVVNELKEAEKQSDWLDRENEGQNANDYRELANKYLCRRQELYEKARFYNQSGKACVAQYYSSLAAKQTAYFERANSMAAEAFLQQHSKQLHKFNTVDLHFLYVKEAIPALDRFIDMNINLLKGSTAKTVEKLDIITGRGKRSANGLSRIKPAVIRRLKTRGLRYVELNPGLLSVKINENSKMTTDL